MDLRLGIAWKNENWTSKTTLVLWEVLSLWFPLPKLSMDVDDTAPVVALISRQDQAGGALSSTSLRFLQLCDSV